MSLTLADHKAAFNSCTACPLGVTACSGLNLRVYYSGPIPCEFLFVGEASGDSEMDTGIPFIGQTGKILRDLVRMGMPNRKIGYTNSVICPPQDSAYGRLRTPKKSEVNACRTRLEDLIQLVKPKWIIAVGNYGEHALAKLYEPHQFTKIVHPSFISRKDAEGAGLEIRKDVLMTLKTLNEKHGQETSAKKVAAKKGSEKITAKKKPPVKKGTTKKAAPKSKGG